MIYYEMMMKGKKYMVEKLAVEFVSSTLKSGRELEDIPKMVESAYKLAEAIIEKSIEYNKNN